MSYCLKTFSRILALCMLLSASGFVVAAQSGDINAPTPVRKSDLLGRIAARDLGDSRLTNHYYAFTGTPGDLVITIQSRNLNGDIDVFTAGTLRPLLKLSLYAESSSPVTKSIYLRRRENLILRIEARSPNDDEGTYQILFSGSFEAVIGGPDIAEGETPTTETPTTARKGKRVTSVGARIDEPAPPVTEVAAVPTPEPEATPVESPTPRPGTRRTTTTTPPASSRTRRPAGRRVNTPAPKPTATPAAEETAKQTEETKPSEEPGTPTTEPTAAPSPKPRTPRRSNTARSGTTARPVKPASPTPAEPEPEIGPRLIIETNDGTVINRSMSTVRRVTVENGWVVIVSQKTGKVDRVLLANVVKMTIQPQ